MVILPHYVLPRASPKSNIFTSPLTSNCVQGNQYDKAKEHHLYDCIECGACSYVCPSQIPLVDYYKYAKAELNYLEFKKTKSESSQIKFENRENRLLRLKAQRAAKRKRTTKRTQNPEKVKKDLQATLDRVKLNLKNKE